MPLIAQMDAEALARPEGRAELPFLQVLRLYLDPSPLFKNVNAGAPHEQARALEYNRRNRCILLPYAQRWGVIALACLFGLARLGTANMLGFLLYVPVLGLALGLAISVTAVLINLSVYLVLGIDSR